MLNHLLSGAAAAIVAVAMTSSTATSAAGTPRIGPGPDRYYVVIGSKEVLKPTLMCGFNRLSLPKPGVFRRETRQYYKRVRNSNVKDGGPRTVDVFVRCHKV